MDGLGGEGGRQTKNRYLLVHPVAAALLVVARSVGKDAQHPTRDDVPFVGPHHELQGRLRAHEAPGGSLAKRVAVNVVELLNYCRSA